MKTLNLLLALLFAATIANAQAVDSSEVKFKKVLDDGKMMFTMPEGFVKIPIVKNMQCIMNLL